VLLVSALVGCSAPVETPAEESTSSQTSAFTGVSYWWWMPSFRPLTWSIDLYGRDLNGRALNGGDLSRAIVLGVSLTNVRHNGRVLEGVRLEGTTFRSNSVSANGFAGATFEAVLDDGTLLPVRIERMRQHPSLALRDVTLYDVSYQTNDGWRPFCGTDDDGDRIAAIPLRGRWDYRQGVPGGGARVDDPSAFTFACRGFALAKCVELGYRPWLNGRLCNSPRCPEIAMADLHQACTRAVRADFCGDGTPYTNDGTVVHMFDKYGVALPNPGWAAEAEWTPTGARCATRLRVPDRGTPTCFDALADANCGSPWNFATTSTLLMSQERP
jgi:hypothetical protein